MLLQENDDQELLEQWRQGGKQAFNQLFDRYFNKLLQFSLKRISDPALAEELVMDVMLRLWQHKDNLNAENSLNGYLFKSVQNAIIDQLRKKAIETVSVEIVFQADNALIAHLNTGAPDEQLHSDELKRIYQQTLTQLSPKRKKVFEMSRHEGKSHKEISVEMDVSISTVKQHINASLHTIREVLKEHTDIAFLIILSVALLK